MNSGWDWSSSITRGCHWALPSTLRTVSGRMPAARACWAKASRHWAKAAEWSTAGALAWAAKGARELAGGVVDAVVVPLDLRLVEAVGEEGG